jgi:hypothetical protein
VTTFEMLKVINFQLAAIVRQQAEEFEHMQTALGDIMRDLDEVKQRLPAPKVGRRGVHRNTKALKP